MGKWDLKKLEDICEILDHKRVPITASERKSGIYPYYGANGVQDYISDYIFDDELVLLAEDGGHFGSKTKPIAYRVSGKCWVNNHAHVLKPKSFVDADYLCYSLMFYDVTKIITGTTRPKLTQSAMRKMTVPLPPLETQKQIAKTLNTIVEVLALRKQQLEELNHLIKSVFYDMFGDPVVNEKGWECKPLENCFHLNPKKSEIDYFTDDFLVSFVPMQSVSENGEINTTDIREYREVKTGFTYFYENDVLLAKITPCMENGKGAIAKNLKNNIGFGSTEFHVLRPIEGISTSEWLYHLTSLPSFRKNAEKNMTGSAGQKRVPAAFFEKCIVPLPPYELQHQFADIVAKIEEQKKLVKKAIDETQTLFDSLMSQYFD